MSTFIWVLLITSTIVAVYEGTVGEYPEGRSPGKYLEMFGVRDILPFSISFLNGAPVLATIVLRLFASDVIEKLPELAKLPDVFTVGVDSIGAPSNNSGILEE